jgi:hypothetical protein
MKRYHHNRGYLLIYVLIFASVFMVILTSFVTFIVTQTKLIEQRVQFEQAGQIAEAGLNYYRWYLAHYPNSTTTAITGVYSDPELGPIGEYTLTLASTTFCGTIMSRQITSVGATYADSAITRRLSARYARPNVAEYSFIINSNVWAGDDRVINGPYHSNGGIRMDGTHNSSVTSGQGSWTCTSSFGCSPSGTRDGVFTTTANANPALFATATAPVNFGAITVDLSDIENKARTGGGIFLPKAPGGDYGYHIVFNSTSSITVRRVQNTLSYWGYTTENGWQTENHIITALRSPVTYLINSSCPVIAVQDKVWIEGVVPNKMTLAASHATSTTMNPSIILEGNITYTSPTSSGLLAIAEQDVLIGVTVPEHMTLNGIFIAQNGRYGRNHYDTDDFTGTYDPFVILESETHNGTIVSNGRVGTQWTSGGVTTSGFKNRYTSYDRNLVESPPPFIPETSDVYEYSDWRDAN